MSNNAVLSALRRLDISGDEMTGHGFRATKVCPTYASEQLIARVDGRWMPSADESAGGKAESLWGKTERPLMNAPLPDGTNS